MCCAASIRMRRPPYSMESSWPCSPRPKASEAKSRIAVNIPLTRSRSGDACPSARTWRSSSPVSRWMRKISSTSKGRASRSARSDEETPLACARIRRNTSRRRDRRAHPRIDGARQVLHRLGDRPHHRGANDRVEHLDHLVLVLADLVAQRLVQRRRDDGGHRVLVAQRVAQVIDLDTQRPDLVLLPAEQQGTQFVVSRDGLAFRRVKPAPASLALLARPCQVLPSQA